MVSSDILPNAPAMSKDVLFLVKRFLCPEYQGVTGFLVNLPVRGAMVKLPAHYSYCKYSTTSDFNKPVVLWRKYLYNLLLFLVNYSRTVCCMELFLEIGN